MSIARKKLGIEPARFDVRAFLDSAGAARTITEFGAKDTIFTQGDPGKTVMPSKGLKCKALRRFQQPARQSIVAVFEAQRHSRLEKSCQGMPVRIATATAISPVTVLVIGLKEMMRVLHAEHEFSDRFITYMVEAQYPCRKRRIDQLFNSSDETAGANILLLARYNAFTAIAPVRSSQNIAGDARGNGGHHSIPRQFFHEQI